MSQIDLPLWARAAAVGLLLFASWWLLDTEAVRNLIGDGTALVSLGIIAISILRGMHLPLGLWPQGPWRKEFLIPPAPALGLIIAILIVLSRARDANALASSIDFGTGTAIVAGAVCLGFSIAFIKQRRFVPWYGLAFGLACIPLVSLVGLELILSDNGSSFGCIASIDRIDDATGEKSIECAVGWFRAFIFFAAVGIPARLVTEEVAFRRLLIGSAAGAGVAVILGSAVFAACWYLIQFWAGVGTVQIVVMGGIGALSAGCLYVLSSSLTVSALFTGVYSAAYLMIASGGFVIAEGAPSIFRQVTWVTALLVALVLLVLVFRRNGLLGNLAPTRNPDASSN